MDAVLRERRFNSNTVLLKESDVPDLSALKGSFNSNTVLLKEVGLAYLCDYNDLFQFQYGAIEGRKYVAVLLVLLKFQFQYGAIEGFL